MSVRLTKEEEEIWQQHQQLLDYTDYVRNVVTADMYAELSLTFEEWLESDCPEDAIDIRV